MLEWFSPLSFFTTKSAVKSSKMPAAGPMQYAHIKQILCEYSEEASISLVPCPGSNDPVA